MGSDKLNESHITDAVSLCVQNNLTFAAYRLPDESSPRLVIQGNMPAKVVDKGADFDAIRGFIVAPFSDQIRYPRFLIEPRTFFGNNISRQLLQELQSLKNDSHNNTCTEPPEITKKEYIALLRNIIDKIHQGVFEKVVPSRVKLVNGKFASRAGLIFTLLCRYYPNAFVYIFNNGCHLWIGATPEAFLLASNGTMQTVSLAGTRPYSEHNLNIGAWNSKERLEQEYVTRYISGMVSRFNVTQVNLQGPYIRKAGNLLHLCSDFFFPSDELKGRLGQFLDNLHPTPAVCGMPYRQSLELLSSAERHNREYYAGYLGPVGLEKNISLFVNLRCMKILSDKAALFVGGGITADSVPDDEWNETEIKAETLLSVIRLIEHKQCIADNI